MSVPFECLELLRDAVADVDRVGALALGDRDGDRRMGAAPRVFET